MDIIQKPRIGAADYLADEAMRIREVVKSASHARLPNIRRAEARSASASGPAKKLTADAMPPPPTGRAMAKTTEMVVCVGALDRRHRGAARDAGSALPANAPGMVIVQHMPEKFTAAFAQAARTAFAKWK